jgi:hypothetical protein
MRRRVQIYVYIYIYICLHLDTYYLERFLSSSCLQKIAGGNIHFLKILEWCPQSEGFPLIGCLRLLVQNIRSYPPYPEFVCSIHNVRMSMKWVSEKRQTVKCVLRPKEVMSSAFLRLLYHTQRRTTVGRTPLDEWSANRRDLSLTTHNKQETNNHAPGGIGTHNLGWRASGDLHLRLRGHWDRPWFLSFHWLDRLYDCDT